MNGQFGIDTIDPSYYTVAHGDGQTTASAEADLEWVATHDLPRTAPRPFYTRLNQILDTAGFDGYVEWLCQQSYADEIGRPGLRPDATFARC